METMQSWLFISWYVPKAIFGVSGSGKHNNFSLITDDGRTFERVNLEIWFWLLCALIKKVIRMQMFLERLQLVRNDLDLVR